MILTTTENISEKRYQIIDVVEANAWRGIFSTDRIRLAKKRLEKEGNKLDADAIVGIKIFTHTLGQGTSIIGTAIKFI